MLSKVLRLPQLEGGKDETGTQADELQEPVFSH